MSTAPACLHCTLRYALGLWAAEHRSVNGRPEVHAAEALDGIGELAADILAIVPSRDERDRLLVALVTRLDEKVEARLGSAGERCAGVTLQAVPASAAGRAH